jgi:hypothetical protein
VTATATRTQHYDEQGREVFPCRCGVTHTGDYALYDWLHHNCFHDQPLINISHDEHGIDGYYMCPACGKTFWLKDRMPE